MEGLVMLNPSFWSSRSVLLTGHTGLGPGWRCGSSSLGPSAWLGGQTLLLLVWSDRQPPFGVTFSDRICDLTPLPLLFQPVKPQVVFTAEQRILYYRVL